MTRTTRWPRRLTPPRPCAVVLLAAIAAQAFMASGCSGGPPATAKASTGPVAAVTRTTPPAACADVRKVINDATARFTAQLDRAVRAGEKGDAHGQSAAMSQLKTTFRDWAEALRAQAGKADDPRMQAVLEQYAGAVDAAIARVRSPADLEALSTFDDQELDVVASKLQDVCP